MQPETEVAGSKHQASSGRGDTGSETQRGPFGVLSALGRLRAFVIAAEGWRFWLLGSTAGAFMVTAMAPFYFLPAYIISFLILIWMLDRALDKPKPWRSAAFAGWLFGFGFFLAGLYWIGFAFLVEAETFAWLLPIVAPLFPSAMAIFTVGTVLLAFVFWRGGTIVRVLALAASWAAFEWLRGHILTGFPWNLLGTAWLGVLPVAQSASWIGVYGLSFLTAAAAISFAAVLDPGRLARISGAGRGLAGIIRRDPAAGLALAFAGVLVIMGGLGTWRMAAVTPDTVPGVTLRIVQPGTLQQDRLIREKHPQIVDNLVSLTARPGLNEVTHVIWPEAASPYVFWSNLEDERYLAGQKHLQARLASILPEETHIVTGSVRAELRPGAHNAVNVYNALFVIDGQGRIVDSYDKSHLVPFGEYMPFPWLFEAVGLRQLASRFGISHGSGRRTLAVPNAPAMAPLICYEIIFPGAVIAMGGTRPGWIANITDDVWFGNSTGPRQHLDIARMRAIDEGLPVIRAANNGISAVIDPLGRVQSRLDLNETGILDSALPRALAPTPYSNLKDSPFLFALALTFLLCWILISRNKQNSRS